MPATTSQSFDDTNPDEYVSDESEITSLYDLDDGSSYFKVRQNHLSALINRLSLLINNAM